MVYRKTAAKSLKKNVAEEYNVFGVTVPDLGFSYV